MEIVKSETPEIEVKESKLIIVIGVDAVSKAFLKEALMHIISQAGYSVNVKPFEEKEETDFHIIEGDKFSIEHEAKSSLVFSSYRNPVELVEANAPPEERENDENWGEYVVGEKLRLLDEFYELTKWMRSGKLAYCMDYNSPMNTKGLHNYSNLRNMILPLMYAFQQTPPEEGKQRFDKINPQVLIELLVPDLKVASQEASEKFEEFKVDKAKKDE